MTVRQKNRGAAAVLAGVGAYVPPKTVTNADLSAHLDTSPDWITSRTGIEERHVVSAGESSVDLAVEAGNRALKSAGTGTVDMVVLATTSPDRLCPAGAPEVAHRLGLGIVPAFDLTSACSGFLFGLATAQGLIASETAESVLLVGAEAFTTFVDPADRGTAVIFGDGAGAVVLRAGSTDEPGAIGPVSLGTDGSHADLLHIPSGGSRQRSATGLGHGLDVSSWYLQMAGRTLFQQAVARMTEASRSALEQAGWPVATVDRFVGHQANLRILTAVAKRLEIPAERLFVNIDRVGNTLAASIPLALTAAASGGELTSGDRVLLSAFGAGLSWGGTTLVWPDLVTDAPL
ncbi:3-oxoacyl-ACP synthase [Amycolatopsis orientalis]|uniref:Beta-ketoacyl-[acyl-carrier-protein] synthase III n=1 Tax=Amycolatopsis orientalis TaxID=31958 RepID=A0A193BUL9_AMYOR|nr:beta-ketoacyl-ACP synthase III [Amycolatopsis orientalis]ANN15875.1 3-oxoacyl-ACP synthase [Amycolatopsis orientalis]